MALKMHPSLHRPAGVWLYEEIVKPYRLTVTETADRLGVSRPTMSNLLNGNSGLSPEMAIRFEKAFGISASAMLRMQSAYDLAQAWRNADSIKIKPIPEPA